MVHEDFPNFIEWLPIACIYFLLIVAISICVGTLYGYLVATAKHGPGEAFFVVAIVIFQAIPDWFHTSPRRVYAMSKLAVQEAMRRRVVLVTFGIFALALLIGGWFLDVDTESPDKLYITFVSWGTQILVLLLGLLLSAFSLPQDIRDRTIYTVVTKPVRATEIVLGRIFGFSTIGTVLLVVMGIISYFFVVRGVSHSHGIDAASMQEIDPKAVMVDEGRRVPINVAKEGRTSYNSNHSHRVWELKNGDLITDVVSGHVHDITASGEGQNRKFAVSAPHGNLQVRVPIYSEMLHFLDEAGNPAKKGVNVGKMWEYRSYFEGGVSLGRAIWDFKGVTADKFASDQIPLELSLQVFRTHKGNVERRVTGTLIVKSTQLNADGINIEYETAPIIFESQEFLVQTINIDRKVMVKWVAPDGSPKSREMDFFDEFCPSGNLSIWLKCNETGQYFGVARGDMYFRAAEGSFAANMFKSYVSIWLQMIVVISVGVTMSTFLSGPIALIGTVGALSFGFFSKFIHDIFEGEISGGGPIESSIRMVRQGSLTLPIGTGIWVDIVIFSDKVVMYLMDKMTFVVPSFARLNTSSYLANGFEIPTDAILIQLCIGLSFCLGVTIVGYFCLKTREIAK